MSYRICKNVRAIKLNFVEFLYIPLSYLSSIPIREVHIGTKNNAANQNTSVTNFI